MSKHSIAPYLLYPFANQPHYGRADITHHTHEWIRSQNLVRDDQTWRDFTRIDAPGLAAYACPYGSLDALKILSDWIAWLYLLDDICDENGLDSNAETQTAFFNDLLAYYCEGASKFSGERRPLFVAARCLFERMSEHLDAEFALWYARPLRKYFDALLWEEGNRRAGEIQSLEDYREWRIYAGAVFLMFGLTELLVGRRFSPGFHDHSAIIEHSKSAARIICWANDLFSFQREEEANDIHNLVLLLESSQGMTRNAAIEASITMHNDEMRNFLDLEFHKAPNGLAAEDVRQYNYALKVWLQGAFDWTLSTVRYQDFEFVPKEIRELSSIRPEPLIVPTNARVTEGSV